MTRPYKRKRKLIRPGLQLRLSGVFVGLVTLMLLLQYMLLGAELYRAAGELPSDGTRLLAMTDGVALRVVVASALVFLPLTLLVGVLASFRIAGPVYRFERFLEALRDGEQPEDFQLRDGDELKEIATLLNDATRPMRTRATVEDPGGRARDAA